VGWLDDQDAEDALRIAEDRNLTVHMCKQEVGEDIAGRLANQTEVLRRWLSAPRQWAAADD
jgi:hypothetical protein